MKKKQTKKRRLNWFRVWFVILLLPAAVVCLTMIGVLISPISGTDVQKVLTDKPKQLFEPEFPLETVPLYKEAAEAYGIPWQLLAAHHRIETRFSTMDPLVSPAGAEGHLQFMPCTFVGWQHPTCSGLGEGEISSEEKVDPAAIAQYGGYGIDGNGDGTADPFNLADALYSAAHYLSENGAADGDLERAIFQYNHSEEYVEDVLFYYDKYVQKYE